MKEAADQQDSIVIGTIHNTPYTVQCHHVERRQTDICSAVQEVKSVSSSGWAELLAGICLAC
jgi:hypothetical protein